MKKKIYNIFAAVICLCITAVLVYLNIKLMFDNVVWGDEAFSVNTVGNTDLYGIFQRIFYWDSHPPFYYYWLRLFLNVFGHQTWAFHLASVIPYVLGILIILLVVGKKIGPFPTLFFVLIASLSETCIQYNLEIRMYSMVFFEILMCTVFCYLILSEKKNIGYWIGLVLFCTLAAYTHYYGLITSGVLLVVTSVLYFIRHKGKSWLYGLISLIAYIVLYIPWIMVLLEQMKRVYSSWWMDQPETLNNVLTFIFGGSKVKYILIPSIIIFSLTVLVVDSILVKKNSSEDKQRTFSPQARGIIMGWLTILLVLISAYTISYVYKPILARRYTYPLVPIVLFVYILSISRLVEYANMIIHKWLKGIILCGLVALFISLSYISYSDYIFYRDLANILDLYTGNVLDLIGTPNEDAVFTAYDVKHLSWTVLAYYYPNNTVLGQLPYEIENDPSEIWAFIGTPLSEDQLALMSDKNYTTEVYPDMWLSQYHCNIYHFHK